VWKACKETSCNLYIINKMFIKHFPLLIPTFAFHFLLFYNSTTLGAWFVTTTALLTKSLSLASPKLLCYATHETPFFWTIHRVYTGRGNWTHFEHHLLLIAFFYVGFHMTVSFVKVVRIWDKPLFNAHNFI